MKIGLFDSGIGGLTVLKSLMNRYPLNEYIYLGDTLNIPYGDKNVEELNKLAKKNINFLLDMNVDIIIIACGTVSSNCLDYLKRIYNIPIYDIISPVINYINTSSYDNIGVLGTSRTVKSHVFKSNINKKVYEIEAPKLVPLIESNNLDLVDNILEDYLGNYYNKIDALILGCTHYPIVYNHLINILPKNIKILNMADYLKIDNGNQSSLLLYFTKLDDILIENTKNILNNENLVIKEVKLS